MMAKLTKKTSRKSGGFILPLTLVMLAILIILGLGMVFWFSNTTCKELGVCSVENKYHGATHAGISRADHHLRRPDNPSEAHKWTKGHKEEFTMNIDGAEVTVTIEDIEGS